MEAYSLFEVNQYIKRVIALNFDEPIWVECEINQVSNSRGNLYIELIEKDESSDQIVAKSSATLWYRQYLFIKKKLDKLTESILTEGIKVKLKVTVVFSERYGMSLNIQDIDPAFTFGQFELNRQKIIEALKAKDLLERNGELELPTVIQKVAVISSETAAGYQDFKNQIFENGYGYDFHIDLFQTAMQGQKTEKEVVEALKEASKGDYDVIAIIRGGGSKLDLSGFDNLKIAEAIALSPKPVLTGIGHDIDQTVSDVVANKVLKTPTAVADFIVEHNSEFESELLYYLQLITQRTSSIIKEQNSLLLRSGEQLKTIPLLLIQNQRRLLDHIETDINTSIKETLSVNKLKLESAEKMIDILQPTNILKRGFALVQQDGKYVSRKSAFKTNKKETKISFYDGEVKI